MYTHNNCIYIYMYICIDTCYLILYLHIHLGCHKFYHLIFYYMYNIFHDSMVPGLHRCAAGRRCPGRSGLRGRRRGADAHRAAAGASEFLMAISWGFPVDFMGYTWDIMGYIVRIWCYAQISIDQEICGLDICSRLGIIGFGIPFFYVLNIHGYDQL